MNLTEMSHASINDHIVAYIRKHYVPDESISIPTNKSLIEEGLIDSFAVVELVTFLEQSYGIRIPDSDTTRENFGSIERMANYLAKRTGSR
jgi:acyl carrier protein